MNLALWIAAGLLTVVFLVSSTTKLFVPKDKLAAIHAGAEWTGDFSVGFVKTLGAIELLPAVGLLPPAAVGIAPVLVPLAAVGVVLLLIGAITMRLRRGERKTIVPDLGYLALAAFLDWGRLGPESFIGSPGAASSGGRTRCRMPTGHVTSRKQGDGASFGGGFWLAVRRRCGGRRPGRSAPSGAAGAASTRRRAGRARRRRS